MFNNRHEMDKLTDITWKGMQVIIDEFLEVNKNKIIILDGIQDPGNLGTIIRSAVEVLENNYAENEENITVCNGFLEISIIMYLSTVIEPEVPSKP